MKSDEQPQIRNDLLEKYILEELSESKKAEIEAALKNDPALASKLEELKRSNETILNSYPSNLFISSLLIKRERDKNSILKRFFGQPMFRFYMKAIPALVCLVLFVNFYFFTENKLTKTDNPLETTRIKGLQPSLSVYTVKAGKIIKLTDNSLLKSGDSLQLAYITGGKKYGTIFSIDGNKVVTLHFPEHEGKPGIMTNKGETILPSAYKLDKAPLFEKFFFIASDKPFTADKFISLFRQNPDVDFKKVPGEFFIKAFNIRKEEK